LLRRAARFLKVGVMPTPTPKIHRLDRRNPVAQILTEFDAYISIASANFVRNSSARPNAQNQTLRLQRQRRSIAVSVRRGPKMKKKEDARLAVLREYDRWAKDHPNDAKKMGGFVFFGYLEKERPDLLDFRPVGSKWQTVHAWLRHGGRLKD
jgi:hypothetical protein